MKLVVCYLEHDKTGFTIIHVVSSGVGWRFVGWLPSNDIPSNRYYLKGINQPQNIIVWTHVATVRICCMEWTDQSIYLHTVVIVISLSGSYKGRDNDPSFYEPQSSAWNTLHCHLQHFISQSYSAAGRKVRNGWRWTRRLSGLVINTTIGPRDKPACVNAFSC